MTKKTRLIILLVCVACFLIIAPILVGYSMGYRFDFEKMKVVATGGIYVKSFPEAEKITIDSKISEKPGLFSNNAIFVQSLLPKNHTVLIEKTGYYDYFKTLPVQEKKVTKLENVLLIKKNIQFQIVSAGAHSPFNNIEKFIIKNNNLYYSSTQKNLTLTAVQKSTPIIKNVITFCDDSDLNLITWLGTDGILYQSNIVNPTGEIGTKVSLMPVELSNKNTYKLVCTEVETFLIINNELFSYASDLRAFEDYNLKANDIKVSPNGLNIIYYYNNAIYYYNYLTHISQLKNSPEPILLYNSSEKVENLLWLNNNYIIFTTGEKIIISEIDFRGNINTVTLPQTITVSPTKKIDIISPKISFDRQNGKLYVLTGDTLLLSEKITP